LDNPDDEGSNLLQNVSNKLPINMVWCRVMSKKMVSCSSAVTVSNHCIHEFCSYMLWFLGYWMFYKTAWDDTVPGNKFPVFRVLSALQWLVVQMYFLQECRMFLLDMSCADVILYKNKEEFSSVFLLLCHVFLAGSHWMQHNCWMLRDNEHNTKLCSKCMLCNYCILTFVVLFLVIK
jgi:hypothetical protein